MNRNIIMCVFLWQSGKFCCRIGGSGLRFECALWMLLSFWVLFRAFIFNVYSCTRCRRIGAAAARCCDVNQPSLLSTLRTALFGSFLLQLNYISTIKLFFLQLKCFLLEFFLSLPAWPIVAQRPKHTFPMCYVIVLVKKHILYFMLVVALKFSHLPALSLSIWH